MFLQVQLSFSEAVVGLTGRLVPLIRPLNLRNSCSNSNSQALEFADIGESSPLSDFLKCIWRELFFSVFCSSTSLKQQLQSLKAIKFSKNPGFLVQNPASLH